CLPNDPNGKLNIAHHAGYWLHGEDGRLTKAIRHICWDGCMFPNFIMELPETWNDILAAMISVRDAHGWREEEPGAKTKPEPRAAAPVIAEMETPARVKRKAAKRPTARKPLRAGPKALKKSVSKK